MMKRATFVIFVMILLVAGIATATTTTSTTTTTTTTIDISGPLFINTVIPEFYNDVELDIELLTKPSAEVFIYVNGELKRHSVMDATGFYRFADVTLNQNLFENKINIEAKDSTGSVSQDFSVKLDLIPPTVTLKNLTDFTDQATLTVQGTVSEDVNAIFYLSYESGEKFIEHKTDIAAGSFSETVNFNKGEGNYELEIKFNDSGGNIVAKTVDIAMDASPPAINLNPALNQLSPSYVDTVRIKGTTDPNALIIVFVNEKTSTHKSYSLGVVSILEKLGRLVEGKTELHTTADGEGNFMIDVQLTQDIAVRSEDSITITRPGGTGYVEEIRYSTGNQWRNSIKIVAIDKYERESQPITGEIMYAYCGAGGYWGVTIENPTPSIIQPIHLLRGIASLGFNYRLEWNGPGDASKARINGRPRIAKYTKLSGEESKEYDNDLIPSGDIFSQFSQQAKVGSVTINLMKWQKTEQEIEDMGKLKFFLEMEIPYTFDYYGAIGTGRQRKCIPIHIQVDKNIMAHIPDGMLKFGVKALNATIDVIDTVLDVVEDVRKFTFVGCIAMQYGYNQWMWIKEKLACVSYATNLFTPPVPEHGETIELACSKEGDKQEDCEKCWEAKVSRRKAEKTMQWVCDRVYCPAAPSVEYYAQEQKSNQNKIYYYFEDDEPVVYQGSQCYDYDALRPSYSIPASSENIDSCGKEYKYEWDPACISVDEYRKSFKETYDTNFFNSFVDFTSDICSKGEKDQYVRTFEANVLGKKHPYLVIKLKGDTSVNDPTANMHLKRSGSERVDFQYEFDKGEGGDGIRNYGQDREVKIKLVSFTYLYKKGYRLFNRSERTNGVAPKVHEWREAFISESGVMADLDRAVNEIMGLPDYNYYDKYYQCNDGIDNDDDGLIDFTTKDGDPDCTSVYDDTESEDRPPSGDLAKDPQEVGKWLAQKYCIPPEAGESKKQDDANKETLEAQSGCDAYSSKFPNKGNDKDLLTCKTRAENHCDVIHAQTSETEKEKDLQSKQEQDEGQLKEKLIAEIYNLIQQDVFDQRYQDKWVVDPTSGLLRSASCVCLPAFEGYLKHYKNIADATKQCFNQILLTGDTTAQFCKAVMTQYVCDIIHSSLKCVGKMFGENLLNAGTNKAHEGGGIGSFLGALFGASESVGKSVENRYGATSMFNVMYREQGLWNSACLAAWGGDWNIELENLFVRAQERLPLKSLVYVFPSTRRYFSTNIITGLPTYVYHVGFGALAGANVQNLRVQLVCSTDTTCDPGDNYQNGICDCYYTRNDCPTGGCVHSLRVPGSLKNGETYSYDFYEKVETSKVRFDKVRVTYEYIDNKNERQQVKEEFPISLIGGSPPAECTFDVTSLMFSCGIDTGVKGTAYFNGIPRFISQTPTFMIGDMIKLQGTLTKMSPKDNPNSPMYLVAKVTDQDGVIIGGSPKYWHLQRDGSYTLDQDSLFTMGVPGLSIQENHFSSVGGQSRVKEGTRRQGVYATIDGQLRQNIAIELGGTVNNSDWDIKFNIITQGDVYINDPCAEADYKDCILKKGGPNSFEIDGVTIILQGIPLASDQSGRYSDTINLQPQSGIERNWKVEISLHYAKEDDPANYDPTPIDANGEQRYSIPFKVINAYSPTAGKCSKSSEQNSLKNDNPTCRCGVTSENNCPTKTNKYCYGGVCRKFPACDIDATNPIKDSCVCDPSTGAGKTDCKVDTDPNKKSYCYKDDDAETPICHDEAKTPTPITPSAPTTPAINLVSITGLVKNCRSACKLKPDAANKLKEAQTIAEREGYNLCVFDSYRTEARQKELYDLLNPQNMPVCGPDFANCPHVNGGAVDMRLCDNDGKYLESNDNYKKLQRIMIEAGWAWFRRELQHFEYGTTSWRGATNNEFG